jgi:hypothetical protein
MTSCGLEEARVYSIIMDAIEMGNLAVTSIDGVRTDAPPVPSQELVIIDAEPEQESSEPSAISEGEEEEPFKVKVEEAATEISEEETFFDDVENLLSEENKEEKED